MDNPLDIEAERQKIIRELRERERQEFEKEEIASSWHQLDSKFHGIELINADQIPVFGEREIALLYGFIQSNSAAGRHPREINRGFAGEEFDRRSSRRRKAAINRLKFDTAKGWILPIGYVVTHTYGMRGGESYIFEFLRVALTEDMRIGSLANSRSRVDPSSPPIGGGYGVIFDAQSPYFQAFGSVETNNEFVMTDIKWGRSEMRSTESSDTHQMKMVRSHPGLGFLCDPFSEVPSNYFDGLKKNYLQPFEVMGKYMAAFCAVNNIPWMG